METVIIPAWRRDDFLHAALHRLGLIDDGIREYMLCLDRGYTPSVFRVADDFRRRFSGRVQMHVRLSHPFKGNSYNLLRAYADAAWSGTDFVHLVEDDIFIGADYFAAHRQAHALAPDVFAVSACRNQQYAPGTEPPADADAIYLHASYQSLGVSFKPERLRTILPHVCDEYFRDPIGYCAIRWPASSIVHTNAEQDGLMHRIIEASNGRTAYMAVPRAYHSGYIGYHRAGQALNGSLESRSARLLSMSTEELNARARSYPDHVAVPLDEQRESISRVIEWSP